MMDSVLNANITQLAAAANPNSDTNTQSGPIHWSDFTVCGTTEGTR